MFRAYGVNTTSMEKLATVLLPAKSHAQQYTSVVPGFTCVPKSRLQ